MPSTLCLPPFSTSLYHPHTFLLSGKPKWTIELQQQSLSLWGMLEGQGTAFCKAFHNLLYQEDINSKPCSLSCILGRTLHSSRVFGQIQVRFAQSVCVCLCVCVGMCGDGKVGTQGLGGGAGGPGLLTSVTMVEGKVLLS